MKKILFLLAVIAGLAALSSCIKETDEGHEARTVIKVSIDSKTRTGLGEKVGNIYHNYWKTGDRISVNGVVSDALGESYNDKSVASFEFEGIVNAPYRAVYPGAAVSSYSEVSALVTIPAVQNYIPGSYDPAAFIMTGTGTDASTLVISPRVSLVHLTVTGTASISKIVLTGASDAVLSGSFSTDFTSWTPGEVSNSVEMTAATPAALPAEFFICVPAGLASSFKVEMFDDEGGSMSRTATIPSALEAGKMYSATSLAYNSSGNITSAAEGITSCSAVLTWTHVGESASYDVARPYTIALYTDQACTDLVVSHDIEGGHSCWNNSQPRFAFGGLNPSTTYYFKVTDTTAGEEASSDPLEFTTLPFNEVDATTVSAASIGDIILGENFREVSFGPDELNEAAGFNPSSKSNIIYSGENPSGSFVVYNSTDSYVSWANITSGTRLSHEWGYAGNNSSYFRTGYLRNCTSSSGAKTHIVTPKLVGIPEGMFATIEVTVTAARYSGDNADLGVFVESAVLNSSRKMTATYSEAYPLGITSSKTWETKTVTISNVTRDNRLMVGPYESIDTKNRFFLSDISVKLVGLTDVSFKAKKTDSSSSTLVFSWSETGETDASVDVANAYTAALYRDEACTILDQSFDIPAGNGAWKNKTPKYVFGGLEPSTSYWFKVLDTTNNLESNVVKATTDAFTVVEMPSEITAPGVALAEDFGEIRWEYDAPFGAVGFRCGNTSSFSNTTVKTSETNESNGIYQGYRASSGGGEATFKGQGTALSNSTRLNGWVTDSNVYIHPGYLKLGTSSGKGWILTPEFTVPEGKKAIVTVTITGCWAASSQNSEWGVAAIDPELAAASPSAHTAAFEWPDTDDFTRYQTISFTKQNVWATNSITGLELRHKDRIVFGACNGCASNKARVCISDMVVNVLAVVDEGAEVNSFNLENTSVTAYFDKAQATYTDSNWSTVSYLSDYCDNSSSNRKDIPAPAIVTWGYSSSYTVNVYNDSGKNDLETTVSGTGSHADIYNLVPGKTYYYTVTDGASTTLKVGSFQTSGRVRMMKVSSSYSKGHANNCRDLGGWATTDGHTIKYGKIFRGTRMDDTTDAEKEYLTGYMGIKGDVELRSEDAYQPFSDSKWGVAYLQTEYTNWDSSGKTTNLKDPANIKKTFNDIIGYVTAGKPIYIHCSAGADRTGYICMLIEAVLGVSPRDCSIDYELTSFSICFDGGEHIRDRSSKIYDQYFAKGMGYISGYSGSTFQQKATNILLDAGITSSQISAFRSAMLD